MEAAAEKMQVEVRRLSGYHSKDILAEKKGDFKNEFADKLSKTAIDKRNDHRGSLVRDITAKKAALERSALELADLRARLDYLNGPQARRDDKAMKEIKQRDKAKQRKQKVKARAARDMRKAKREEARAVLHNGDTESDESGSDHDHDDAYELDDFVVPDDDEVNDGDGEVSEGPMAMEIEA